MIEVVQELEEARGLLTFLEERLGLGVWTWDVTENILRWSAGLYAVLGLDPRRSTPSFELYRQIVHPDDRLDFSNPAQVAASGRLESRQFRIIRPSGELRWIRSHGNLLRSADGKAHRMIGFAQDVTDMRKASHDAALQDSLIATVRTVTNGMVWQTAPDGSVVDQFEWWRAADGGHHPGTGWSRLDFVHPEDVESVRAAWQVAIAQREPYRSRFRLRNQAGDYAPVTSSATPIVGPTGELLGWVGLTVPASTTAEMSAGAVPGALVRAARSYLDWSAAELAKRSEVSLSTIRRIEDDLGDAVGSDYVARVIATLREQGIRFVSNSNGEASLTLLAPGSSELSGQVEQ